MDTVRSSAEMMDVFSAFEHNFPENLPACDVPGQEGWIVAEHCILSDYSLFQEFLNSRANTNIPKKCKLSFIDGTIYIKSVPSNPHGQGQAGIEDQMITTLNVRLAQGKRIFRSGGSADHRIGNDNISQPDVAIRRGTRVCPNLIAEINYGRSTRDLVNQCRSHFLDPCVYYVIGIDILDLIGDNEANRQVRLMAHLFQRNVNGNIASVSITSFGNAPLTQQDGNTIRNNIFHHYYQGFEGNVQLRGVGFDPAAPPCNAQDIQYYRLYFEPHQLLADENNVQNITGITQENLSKLQNLLYIDLYIIQLWIRLGFYDEHIFNGTIEPEIQQLFQ